MKLTKEIVEMIVRDFEEGNDYFPISITQEGKAEIHLSCWDDMSEGFVEEDPNKLNFRTLEVAVKVSLMLGFKEVRYVDFTTFNNYNIITDGFNPNTIPPVGEKMLRWSYSEDPMECADCANKFPERDLFPYKYDTEVKVCEGCHDNRMNE